MNHPRLLLEQGHQRLIKARYGNVLYNRNDTVIGRLIETYGEYFEAEVNIFRAFVAPGDVVIDVGANIGVHALALASLVGPSGVVFAFEPQRLAFQTLCANMALNSLDNAHCVNAAVSDSAGTLRLSDANPDAPNNFGGVALSTAAGPPRSPPVPQLVLDDYLAVDRLKLVKIDVEGMEAAVLRGARRTLAAFKPVLYVENDRVENSPELISLLGELGYHLYWHLPVYVTGDNFFGSVEKLFPIGLVDRGGAHLDGVGFAVNLLCIHASLNIPLDGLRRVTNPLEHPYRRDCTQLFSGNDGAGIPVLRE
jgi:FkbM family methyltransferase